ncbi:hypothetical protein SDC9_103452 [bioreactor metagenome]|uniref:Uncharacterized protein n=1 Tax=bioreactor metagenome TaxID=1076179 RepID=A0A645B0G1_9ZZZZ
MGIQQSTFLLGYLSLNKKNSNSGITPELLFSEIEKNLKSEIRIGISRFVPQIPVQKYR